MQGDILPFGLRRNPVWRDSSNVKRERAVVGSDSGILLGIILNFCHFLSDLKGLTLEVKSEEGIVKNLLPLHLVDSLFHFFLVGITIFKHVCHQFHELDTIKEHKRLHVVGDDAQSDAVFVHLCN
jgi:hypothetical protein